MAEGTSTGHAMPKGIKRVEKGVYRTLDGKVDIRQAKDGWSLWRVGEADDEPLVEGQKPFGSRGLAVAWLAEHDLLPAEAPKQEEQPKAEEPKQEPAKPEKSEEQPDRRPRTRKPRSKAAATV